MTTSVKLADRRELVTRRETRRDYGVGAGVDEPRNSRLEVQLKRAPGGERDGPYRQGIARGKVDAGDCHVRAGSAAGRVEHDVSRPRRGPEQGRESDSPEHLANRFLAQYLFWFNMAAVPFP